MESKIAKQGSASQRTAVCALACEQLLHVACMFASRLSLARVFC